MIFWNFAETTESIGNMQLYDFPKLKTDEDEINWDYPETFTDYFSSHMPFRPFLVSVDNKFKSSVFGANCSNVIAGINDFVFSEETVDDYLGITYSPRKLNNIVTTIRLMDTYCKSKNNNFLFFIAPNKNTIYNQYMPSRYINKEISNLEIINEKLELLNINHIDFKKYFESVKTEEYLYHKKDTHWNNVGALYGYYAIMEALDKEHINYKDVGFVYSKTWSPDLGRMLFPAFNELDYQYALDIKLSDFTVLEPRTKKSSLETLEELMGHNETIDTTIQTRNKNAKGSLYLVRDSFGRALLPYFIDNYSKTYITRFLPPNLQNINEPTDVVYEIAERHLDFLLESAPVLYSPKTENILDFILKESTENKVQITNENSIQVNGVLDEMYFEVNSQIFVVISEKDKQTTYEAFPIYENSDYGFSITIDKSEIKTENFDVSVIITNSSGNYNIGVTKNY